MIKATSLLSSLTLSGVLFTSTLLISGAAMATEEPNYTILSQIEDFELRRYESQLVAQTWVSGDQDAASRAGFKVLADYIFGNNTAPSGESSKISMTAPVGMKFETKQPETKKGSDSKKIAMTAPVSMQETDGKWRVQFTMPSQYTMQTLPKPNNPDVTIIEVPAQTYGVIKFSGLAGNEKVAAKTAELQSWMQTQKLRVTGAPELARYNPPWTLPFMRRNEVMIAYQKE
ncbi:SOUL family heme-binding protein [Psychrobacter sp. DAB_AL62B]|uniref:SOUL family heme-binding protein n=1 Tax=Psychrobacter sp. DAB_AL62B TaxID=1028420 RepID=UPI0023813EE3|nr:heme-binding protein [Psychrobacter sp. DAB_AL62B]MDE4454757.1 heme-binding protein [Psychrobacter sp. DAB_AL62B]